MKRVVSAVLTAALVVSMGVSVFAATPSKTVADEVKATGTATVTGIAGIISDVKIEEVKDTTEVKDVLKDVTSSVNLKEIAAGASSDTQKDVTVDITAAQTFTARTTNLLDIAQVELTVESKVVEAAYEEGEQIIVLVAVPTVSASGKVTYTYTQLPAVVRDGKIVVRVSGRQVKQFGSKFTILALKTIEASK